MSTRLPQLASPALPVGACCYRKPEWAIEAATVDAVGAASDRWITSGSMVIARFEAPVPRCLPSCPGW